MPKRRLILGLLGLAALIAALAFALSRPWEPSYQGVILSRWLELYSSAGTEKVPWEERERAALAIRNIGTNALPFLLTWVSYQPREWQDKLATFVTHHENFTFLERFTFEDKRLHRTSDAVIGFKILGALGSPAVPALVRSINDTNHLWAGRKAVEALIYLGPEAVSPIENLLTNSNHPQHRHAVRATFFMDYLGKDATRLVPILAECTKDKDQLTADGAVQSLGHLVLLPDISLPALTNALKHADPVIRYWAVMSVQNFGLAARSAVPALVDATRDQDYLVSQTAKEALRKIAPEALPKAPPR
jgi:hypothetical protein